MKKIVILYFSGAGSARKVAEIIYNSIKDISDADIFPFEDAGGIDLNQYDGIVIGTPVYHAAPAKLVMKFFSAAAPMERPTPAFIYNTRATWSCNTNRILAKHIQSRNIYTVLDRDYRSPASDGSLIVPFVQRFFEFDRQLARKVRLDSRLFLKKITNSAKGYVPRFRLSSIINAPNKLAGQLITFSIHTHKNRCRKCGTCVKNCPHGAMGRDAEGYAKFIPAKCENCYRCIHHCPAKALSLSKRRAPDKLLDFDI